MRATVEWCDAVVLGQGRLVLHPDAWDYDVGWVGISWKWGHFHERLEGLVLSAPLCGLAWLVWRDDVDRC